MVNDVIGMDFFLSIFYRYWGDLLYVAIYLGCIAYICRYGTKLMKQIFAWPFVFLLFTVYNPFVMGPVLGLTDWSDRYYRFYWILPVEILCAYVFAVLIERQKDAGAKVATGLLVICMVLMCADTMVKKIPDENIYKIDNYIVELSEMIGREKSQENPVVLYDADLYYRIRQYDPSLRACLWNEEMQLYTHMYAEEIDVSEQHQSYAHAMSMFVRGVEVEAEYVNEFMQQRNIEFFVRNEEYYSDEYMASLNISYIGEVDGYELYRHVWE